MSFKEKAVSWRQEVHIGKTKPRLIKAAILLLCFGILIKAGNATFVPCVEETKDGLRFCSTWMYEAKRVDFTFSVVYHKEGYYYQFDPALEIVSDEDEAELREEFERKGYTFNVYIGADGKKHAKITKG